jgi:hypothetical protein
MEMATGKATSIKYRNQNPIEPVRSCAGSCELHLRLSDDISRELVDLIVGLTRVHPICRLGNGTIEEVKEHEFFAGVQFGNVRATPPATLSRSSELVYINNSDSSEEINTYECSDPLGCARS